MIAAEKCRQNLLQKGYDFVSVTDLGGYWLVNAQPAQMRDGRLLLGDHLRGMDLRVIEHNYYLDTEICRVSLKEKP